MIPLPVKGLVVYDHKMQITPFLFFSLSLIILRETQGVLRYIYTLHPSIHRKGKKIFYTQHRNTRSKEIIELSIVIVIV